jgi:hypothetical protein
VLVAWVAVFPAVAVGLLTGWVGVTALVPDPDVYVTGSEVALFEGLALVELVLVGYAVWSLVEFLGGRSMRWSGVLAYVIAGALTPVLFLLAIRDFSGG